MSLHKTSQNVPGLRSQDEDILVVKRSDLFATTPAWHGINTTDITPLCEIIVNKQQFRPRTLMEEDPAYKQIIPYMIFMHQDKYFLMQRKAHASEQRLKNKYTLGIGGHVRKEDITDHSIFNWARREFEEEVSYDGELTITPLGILNDDSNDVGRVHLGLVLLLTGHHAAIAVKSELAQGQLASLSTCQLYFNQMESWSQMILQYLKSDRPH